MTFEKTGGPPRFAQGSPVSLSKKSACGGLFRQKLKKCLRPGAQTPRPPGKAGRYEFTLEDLRVLQTSPNGLFDRLTGGPPRFAQGSPVFVCCGLSPLAWGRAARYPGVHSDADTSWKYRLRQSRYAHFPQWRNTRPSSRRQWSIPAIHIRWRCRRSG